MKAILIMLLMGTSIFRSVGQPENLTPEKGLIATLELIDDRQMLVTVSNIDTITYRLYSYVKAKEKHYDYFELEVLTPDHDKMIFSFYEARDKAKPVIVELTPEQSFS
ncbi:MAG: hypothetical protein CVU05_15655, partial [Bacteroidetes bacterium HGW-Bacteroidetes-21]